MISQMHVTCPSCGEEITVAVKATKEASMKDRYTLTRYELLRAQGGVIAPAPTPDPSFIRPRNG